MLRSLSSRAFPALTRAPTVGSRAATSYAPRRSIIVAPILAARPLSFAAPAALKLPRPQPAVRSSVSAALPLAHAPLLVRSIHSSAIAAADPPPRMPPRPTSASSTPRPKREGSVSSASGRSPLPPPPQSHVGSSNEPVGSSLPPTLSPLSSFVAPPPVPRRPFWFVRAWRWLPRAVRALLVLVLLYGLASAVVALDMWLHFRRLSAAPDRATRDALWDAWIQRGVFFGLTPNPPPVVQFYREAQALMESTMQVREDERKKKGAN